MNDSAAGKRRLYPDADNNGGGVVSSLNVMAPPHLPSSSTKNNAVGRGGGDDGAAGCINFCSFPSFGGGSSGSSDHHPRPPNNHKNLVSDPIDSISAMELNQLSAQERNRIYEDIHGVTPIPSQEDDDIQMVQNSLRHMDEEIQRVTKRSAYKRALFLNPKWVTSYEFRIQFLRASNYDACVAANQIIQYFECKLKLFGPDLLAKQRITMNDLNDTDRICIQSCAFQILPQSDRSGRTIFFLNRKHIIATTWKNEVRLYWYFISVALEQEMFQKVGFVFIAYDVGNNPMNNRPSNEFFANEYLLRGLPIKLNGFHYCYDNLAMQPIISLYRTVAGKSFRLRFRFHFGSHQECLYSLASYGIPHGILPLDDDGWQQKDNFLKWLETKWQQEREEEEMEQTRKEISCPKPNDVLLGRGQPCQSHPGNVQLRRLIESKFEAYNAATRKKAVCEKIVILVQQQEQPTKQLSHQHQHQSIKQGHIHGLGGGGRFLEKDESSGIWKLATMDLALEKIANGFRNIKKANLIAVDTMERRSNPSSSSNDDDDDDDDDDKMDLSPPQSGPVDKRARLLHWT